MKAAKLGLLEFLKRAFQCIIPIYQRSYSWQESECEQLWKDIVRTGSKDDQASHFIGSIVYVDDRGNEGIGRTPVLVIDGQQRLTTVTLLIAALARALENREAPKGFSPRQLRTNYLINDNEEDEEEDYKYKLLLSKTDRTSLLAVIDRQDWPKEHSIRIQENFEFFAEQLSKISSEQLYQVCRGLSRLMIVDISLERPYDDPQLIFESLNSTGRKLSQSDLIRNFVLMRLEPKIQNRLYERHWHPMEVAFGQKAYTEEFDAFVRHYLTIKNKGEIPNIEQVYEAFKIYADSFIPENIEPLLVDFHAYADYYSAVALDAESDPELKTAFRNLRELKVNVAYPFLLELYGDYVRHLLSREEFLTIVQLIESYVFRRAICEVPTNSLNKTFATFARGIDKGRYLESVQARFLSLQFYQRFPDDEEFQQKLTTRDLYHFRNSNWLLGRIEENYGSKERANIEKCTIEHIMPQKIENSLEWQAELGPEWEDIHALLLNTLGNLTLTGYNSEYSNRPFQVKRDMPGGFAQSRLQMNAMLGKAEHWNKTTILHRAEELFRHAVQIWPRPVLDPAVLKSYESPAVPVGKNGADTMDMSASKTLAMHPFIDKDGPMHELFLDFRTRVLALHPAVSEDILKSYVAYKAMTNFVDVIPRKKKLILSVNIRINELDDPQNRCRLMTKQNRWANGFVEFDMESGSDLPYAMGLVQQALEAQLGQEESEE